MPCARKLARHRVRARLAGARPVARIADAHRRAAAHHCARRRRPRVAALGRDGLRRRRARGRSSACRGRAAHARSCREQPAFRLRQALVRRRGALARRLVPRRGRVHFGQGSLRLPDQRHAAGQRADPHALQSRSVRARLDRGRRGPSVARGQRAEIRRRRHVRAAGRNRARERTRGGQRAVASHRAREGECRRRLVRADRFPVRPGGSRAQGRRHRRIETRRARAARRRSVREPARHRPADRDARPGAPRAARGDPRFCRYRSAAPCRRNCR